MQVKCLTDASGYLNARLTGSIDTELLWRGDGLRCAGSIRPNNRGLRVRFSYPMPDTGTEWVLLFGITGLKEGEPGRALPVNITFMREGSGEFFATQGDNKCTADEVQQTPLSDTTSERRYRITARGFCTQPARSLTGSGVLLITRFDFVGVTDFTTEDDTTLESSQP